MDRSWASRRALDDRSTVASLDQLYSQALGLAPLLNAACAHWAAGSRGTVCPQLEGHSHHDEPAQAGRRPDWGFTEWESFRRMKAPARAVEKAVTCYRGDVSRVTDICRGRILFDSAADLAACLQLMREHPAARIVWLRNGCSQLCDAAASGGFRVSELRQRCAGRVWEGLMTA